MPLTALLLIVLAAALHAGWNLIVKRVESKQVFTWWALVVGALLYLPLLALYPHASAKVWSYAVGSALVEAIYFIALIRAYVRGDFSLVYPVARGAAPALLALWAILFLGERPRPAGIIGLVILLLGLCVVGGAGWWTRRRQVVLKASGIGAAFGVALCISVYSAIDASAVRIADPLFYLVLITELTAVFITPVVFATYRYREVIAGWRAHRLRILAVGLLMPLTYLLVLQAYMVARVSYVGALREISIVMAALAGWYWLGESFGMIRTVGALLIFVGIFLIAVTG
jgi:drug/metabolite transporter (DMT)-like permease